ncbi:MAG: hypothetical protein ABWX73_11815, partial [Marmoricola sp.]
AVDAVPARSLRVGFTDWGTVRSRLKARLGTSPDEAEIEAFMSRAYDSDFSAASSIDEAAAALQENYGFGPATAQWEAYAQSRRGATMVLSVGDADFDELADNLRSLGYKKPKDDDGVWRGGADLVAGIDPTITPELQYVVLLPDSGLVVSSDNAGYAAESARSASGDSPSLGDEDGVHAMVDRLGKPANALVWSGDFACDDLSMSSADSDDQATAEQLVRTAGGVSPLSGLAMGMEPNRTLRVVAHFEDSDQAQQNLRPRARLAVGEAVGRGGSFADTFRLTESRAVGSEVVLDLRPRDRTGFVLSALYDGPVLFATC